MLRQSILTQPTYQNAAWIFFFSRACSSLFSLSFDDSLVKHLLFPLLVSYFSMATSHAEPVTVQKFAIPALAKDLIAGTVGGWAQVVVGKKIWQQRKQFITMTILTHIPYSGHPFDTLKVRMQTQPSPPIYRNAMDCFRALVKQDGVSFTLELIQLSLNCW